MTRAWPPHALAMVQMLSFIAVCAGCSEKQQVAAEPRLVNTIRVSPSSPTNGVAYSGEIRPRYESNLSFRVAGKIVARNVEIGSIVTKGNALARLDPEDQNLNTRSADLSRPPLDRSTNKAKPSLNAIRICMKRNSSAKPNSTDIKKPSMFQRQYWTNPGPSPQSP